MGWGEISQVKRDQKIVTRNKMAETILCDDTRSFWNEVCKLSAGKNNTLPNMTDGENISEAFVVKYNPCTILYRVINMRHG